MKCKIIHMLSKKYNLDISKCIEIVEYSTFNELLCYDEEYVMHYSYSFWVDEIYAEYLELMRL